MSKQQIAIQIQVYTEAAPCNLARLTEALAKGLHVPVRVDESDLVGFVVRLDDGPFGPTAVVHFPQGDTVRVLYRDPEELALLTLSPS